MILRDIKRTGGVREKVVCIIDDNPNKWNREIEGVPVVGGRNSIQEAVREFDVDKMGMTDWEKEQYLWETIEFLAGCVFYVSEPGRNECVRYKYTVTGGDLVVKGKDITEGIQQAFYMMSRTLCTKVQLKKQKKASAEDPLMRH